MTLAQRPFLLSSVLILGLAMFTGHKWFAPLHIAFVLLVVGVVYLLTLADPGRLVARLRRPLARPQPQ